MQKLKHTMISSNDKESHDGGSTGYTPVYLNDTGSGSHAIDVLKRALSKLLLIIDTDGVQASQTSNIRRRFEDAARQANIFEEFMKILSEFENKDDFVYRSRILADETLIKTMIESLCRAPILLNSSPNSLYSCFPPFHPLVCFFRAPPQLSTYEEILKWVHYAAIPGDNKPLSRFTEILRQNTKTFKQMENEVYQYITASGGWTSEEHTVEKWMNVAFQSARELRKLSDEATENTVHRMKLLHAIMGVSEAEKEQKVLAVIGLENSGKSTLINLMLNEDNTPQREGKAVDTGFPIYTMDMKGYRGFTTHTMDMNDYRSGFTAHTMDMQDDRLTDEDKTQDRKGKGKAVDTGFTTHTTDAKGYRLSDKDKSQDRKGKAVDTGFRTHTTDVKDYRLIDKDSTQEKEGKAVDSVSTTHTTDVKDYRLKDKDSTQEKEGKAADSVSTTHITDVKGYRLDDHLIVVDFPGMGGAGDREALDEIWNQFESDVCVVLVPFGGDVNADACHLPRLAKVKTGSRVILLVTQVDKILHGPEGENSVWEEYSLEKIVDVKLQFMEQSQIDDPSCVMMCILNETAVRPWEKVELKSRSVMFPEEVVGIIREKVEEWDKRRKYFAKFGINIM